MTEQKTTANSPNAQNSSMTKTIVIAIAILAAAFGIGMVLRELRTDSSETEPVTQIDDGQNLDTQEEPREVVYTIPPVIEETPEPVQEVVIESEPAPQPEPVYEEPVRTQPRYTMTDQQRQDATQWMTWFGTLTQEEQMQLFRGSIISFMQLMQRWQTLPTEQVMQERAFLRELIEGWQNLPQEDREQGIENIQIQIEQWLQSGQQY